MKRKGLVILILVSCFFISFAYAENITLKSGKKVTAKIIERTDDYIKVDFYGTPFTYYFDEIETIDGVPVKAAVQKSTILQKKEVNKRQAAGRPFVFQYGTKEHATMTSGQAAVLSSIMLGVMIIELIITILVIISWWVIFTKAGYPGWASIIPFYNLYVMLKVAGRPGIWFILLLIPLVSIIITVIVSIDIAKKFGKDIGFGLGLFFLPFIFFPILAFSGAQYQQASPKEGSPAANENQQ